MVEVVVTVNADGTKRKRKKGRIRGRRDGRR